jgi:hypothetical protein
MVQVKSRFARLAAVAAVVGLGAVSLSACATKEYVDEQIATVNTHLSAVEATANRADQKADAAMAAAQQAGSAAAQANQRIDALSSRVDGLDQRLMAAHRARN